MRSVSLEVRLVLVLVLENAKILIWYTPERCECSWRSYLKGVRVSLSGLMVASGC